MRTPRFETSQTEKDITIIIYAPYTNINDTEVVIENDEFRFYSPPYYLRLHLPGSIVENEESKGTYESDGGKFTFKVDKVNQGEDFKNLEFITTLLNPKDNKVKLNSKIEELDEDDDAEEDEDEIDCFFEQKLPEPEIYDPLNLLNVVKYGFGNKHSGVFKDFENLYKEIMDINNPDQTPECQRMNLRITKEKNDFQEDHYLYDLMESEEINDIIKLEHVWIDKLKDDFTMEEIDVLKELPNKTFLLDKAEIQSIYLSLVDILFSWCYDKRTTEGESTCESAWTINKLSSTFSWLQNFYSLSDVMESCIRRSLCYPLHRHYDVACQTLNDVSKVLEMGKIPLIKCLIDVYKMFNNSEPRYIFNELFLKDMIVWAQLYKNSQLSSLSKALITNIPLKEDLQLNLVEIEQLAYIISEDREKHLISKMSQVKIDETSSSSSEYTSDSDLDSDDSEDEESELDSDDFEEKE